MSKEIKSINEVAQGLAILEKKYALVPDANTPAGLKEITAGIADLRDHWVGLEKKRKEVTADARGFITSTNAQVKAIDAKLRDIAEPWIAAKKAVDEEKARIKQEKLEAEQRRLAALQKRMSDIHSIGANAYTVADLEDAASDLAEVDTSDAVFMEFSEAAEFARTTCVSKLENRLQAAREAEEIAEANQRLAKAQEAEALRLAEQRAELDRQQAAQDKKMADQRAEQQREADKLERQRKQLQDAEDAEMRRVAERERKEREDAEAKEAARREEEEAKRMKTEALEKAKKQRELYKKDADMLSEVKAELWSLADTLHRELSLETDEGRSVLAAALRSIRTTATAIDQSVVVESQRS